MAYARGGKGRRRAPVDLAHLRSIRPLDSLYQGPTEGAALYMISIVRIQLFHVEDGGDRTVGGRFPWGIRLLRPRLCARGPKEQLVERIMRWIVHRHPFPT